MKNIFLTGATGYVGGKLLNLLEKKEYFIRCLVREPRYLKKVENEKVEIVKGDVLDTFLLISSLQGIDVAFYLIHSMTSDEDFREKDKEAAISFASACSKAQVKKIIYLGGLGDSNQKLSEHLKSRQEVGECLRKYAKNVDVIEFRASIIIGAGSLSFEMIRALCDRLPIMITPKWVWNLAQPIGIDDLLTYLMKAIEYNLPPNAIFEIGGKDQMSYGDIMKEYCRQKKLDRWMIPVPFLSLHLSSLWLGLITPLYAKVGKKLIDSIRIPTLVTNNKAEETFAVHPISLEETVKKALADEHLTLTETYSSGDILSGARPPDWEQIRYGKRLLDVQVRIVDLQPEELFSPIQRIGGETGWYYGNFLWKIRGFFDSKIGGVGLRRGRRDPIEIIAGDYIDFWRVEEYKKNEFIRLRAEMKVPGRAWLQFFIEPEGKKSKITQTAFFDPAGISGVLYWYILYPIHYFIFRGMLNEIVKMAIKGKKDKEGDLK